MQEIVSGFGLIEGPVWAEGRGLYFSDVQGGGIHLLSPGGEVSLALPKRRGVGGIALHADGGIVFGGRDISWSPLGGGEGKVLLTAADTPNGIGFNDLTTDPAGRIVVGSVAF